MNKRWKTEAFSAKSVRSDPSKTNNNAISGGADLRNHHAAMASGGCEVSETTA